jgi:hypothetical protein
MRSIEVIADMKKATAMVAISAAALTPYFQCSEWRGINWQNSGILFPERDRTMPASQWFGSIEFWHVESRCAADMAWLRGVVLSAMEPSSA